MKKQNNDWLLANLNEFDMHIYKNIKMPAGTGNNHMTKIYACKEWVIQYNDVRENDIELFAVLAKKDTLCEYKTYVKSFFSLLTNKVCQIKQLDC